MARSNDRRLGTGSSPFRNETTFQVPVSLVLTALGVCPRCLGCPRNLCPISIASGRAAQSATRWGGTLSQCTPAARATLRVHRDFPCRKKASMSAPISTVRTKKQEGVPNSSQGRPWSLHALCTASRRAGVRGTISSHRVSVVQHRADPYPDASGVAPRALRTQEYPPAACLHRLLPCSVHPPIQQRIKAQTRAELQARGVGRSNRWLPSHQDAQKQGLERSGWVWRIQGFTCRKGPVSVELSAFGPMAQGARRSSSPSSL